MIVAHPLAVAVVASLPWWPGAAHGPAAEDDKLCGDCQTTGRIAFEIPRDVIEGEGRVPLCSEIVEDEKLNRGVDFLPCPRCKAPSRQAAVQSRYDAEVERRLKWLAERREVDAHIDDSKLKLMHCSTAHFDIVWTIPKIKVGKRTLGQHEAMHVYAERLEDLYQKYLTQFGLSHTREQNSVRHTVMCFEKLKHSARAQPKYTGIGLAGRSSGAKLMGSTSVFVTWWDKTKNRDDEEFHEYLVHNVAHLFLACSLNYTWLGREQGWADAGFAHYYTEQMFEAARTHCYQEQSELSGWENGAWRPAVRKAVVAGRFPSLADTIERPIDSMDAAQHLFSWSWVEFLIDAHTPSQWIRFVGLLKEKQKVRDALKEAYGYSTLQFTERWKEYVLSSYPSR